MKQIKDTEVDMIEDYMRICGSSDSYSELDNCIPVSQFLEPWAENKQTLFKLLGENLIIQKEIEVEKATDEIEKDISDNLQNRWNGNKLTFYGNYVDWLYSTVDDDKFIRFCDSREDHRILLDLVSQKFLRTNRYEGKGITIHTPSGHDYSFSTGTKIMRILGKIAKEFHLDGFEDFRQAHSLVFNERTFKGQLSLSIHPLDYITMSDNENGWTSCMGWDHHGEYRRGTVEMMTSPVVIEAYMASTVPMSIYNTGQWNNKRWRELFIVDESSITAIKGYPYWNRELEKETVAWIAELAAKNLGWNYTEENFFYKSDNSYRSGRGEVRDMEDQVYPYKFRFRTNAMYNDVYSKHLMKLAADIKPEFDKSIDYSGPSICLCCGTRDAYYDNEGDLVCCDCQPDRWVCDCCGDTFYSNDNMYEVEGSWVCENCVDNDAFWCEGCQEYHWYNESETVYLRNDETEEIYTDPITLCADCINSDYYFPKKKITEFYETNFYNQAYTFPYKLINESDLTEEGLSFFNDRINCRYVFKKFKYGDYIYDLTAEDPAKRKYLAESAAQADSTEEEFADWADIKEVFLNPNFLFEKI